MISHHHKTIFVHIPKCGGQSIEHLFLDSLGMDWEARAPLLLRPNDDYRLGPPRLAHLLADEYTKYNYVSANIFSEYYSFSLMRSPISRAVSTYNYLKLNITFDEFIGEWIPRQFSLKESYGSCPHQNSEMYYFVRPQVDFITNDDGEILINDIFLLENINSKLHIIKEKCKIDVDLKNMNKSNKIINEIDLRKSSINLIRDIYHFDFEFLERNFDIKF